jgi:hypothetical protein
VTFASVLAACTTSGPTALEIQAERCSVASGDPGKFGSVRIEPAIDGDCLPQLPTGTIPATPSPNPEDMASGNPSVRPDPESPPVEEDSAAAASHGGAESTAHEVDRKGEEERSTARAGANGAGSSAEKGKQSSGISVD